MNDRLAIWIATILVGLLIVGVGWTAMQVNADGSSADTAQKSASSASADADVAMPLADTDQPTSCRPVVYSSRNAAVNATYCRPAGTATSVPAVVVLHGCGGLPGLPETARLAKAGIATLEIAYFTQTPSPGAIPENFCRANVGEAGQQQALPVWLENIADGISWLQRLPEVDSERIGIVGWSLGGDVALRAAATDPRLRAVVEYSGTSGMLNPVDQMAADLPPVLILHGDADTVVSVDAARSLQALLDRHDKAYAIEIYPGGDHGWGGSQGIEAMQRTIAFLRSTL